jgi:hypothetical protein
MRHRDRPWIPVTCAFLFLALILAGEGFLLTRSLRVEGSGPQPASLHTLMRVMFHGAK